MAVYKPSILAEQDLTKMFEYGISKFGLSQARDYFNQMHNVFQLLAQNKELGRDASEFIPLLKRFSYKAHTIFYLSTEYGIFIIRVLSQKMNYKNYL